MTEPNLPFNLETDLEKRIAADPAWREGVDWGKPRPGHPEGTVGLHVADVLRNVDHFYGEGPLRARLRLIALIHDTFKFQVDLDQPRTGENHHAMRARRFAEEFVSDPSVLEVIELHDEAYNAWQNGNRDGNWDKARQRAESLIDRLGENLTLYLVFYHCDNATEGKSQECLKWFRDHCASYASADVLPEEKR